MPSNTKRRRLGLTCLRGGLLITSWCGFPEAVLQGPYEGHCPLDFDKITYLPVGGVGVQWTDALQKQAQDWCSKERECYGFSRLNEGDLVHDATCVLHCGQAILCQHPIGSVSDDSLQLGTGWSTFVKQFPNLLPDGLYLFSNHLGSDTRQCWPDIFTAEVCCANDVSWCWQGKYTADKCCSSEHDMSDAVDSFYLGHGCAPVKLEHARHEKEGVRLTPHMFPLRASETVVSTGIQVDTFIAQWADMLAACPGAALRLALDEGWDFQVLARIVATALLSGRLQLGELWEWEIPHIAARKQQVLFERGMRSLDAKRDMTCDSIDVEKLSLNSGILQACAWTILRLALDEGWSSEVFAPIVAAVLMDGRLQLGSLLEWQIPHVVAHTQQIHLEREMRSMAAKRDMTCDSIDHFSGREFIEFNVAGFALKFYAPRIVPTAGGGEIVSFSFGQNWEYFLDHMKEEQLRNACNSLESMLLEESTPLGSRFLDIGSGSGIHSVCLWRLMPDTLVSIDVDLKSVETTKRARDKWGQASNKWRVEHGSILNQSFTDSLGKFDFVYSWGVLHHTGFMWSAIEGAVNLCAELCTVFIALYTDTGQQLQYEDDLAQKRRFNCANSEERLATLDAWVNLDGGWEVVANWAHQGVRGRGMNRFWNILDWIGGLPYEVALPDDVVAFFALRGFSLVRADVKGRQMNSQYVFRRTNQ